MLLPNLGNTKKINAIKINPINVAWYPTVELILMGIAIIVSGLLMMFLADKVSVFLQKNRLYEVLGLFILFIVGIMLLTEGGHIAHLTIFGEEIHPMPKTTFYFVII